MIIWFWISSLVCFLEAMPFILHLIILLPCWITRLPENLNWTDHMMSFWIHYWLKAHKILWLSPNPSDKIQNGGIFDCTPDHMVLHGMQRYYIVFETAIVYSEISKFQLHPNSRPCDHSSITVSVSRTIPVLTLSGTFRGGRMNRQLTTGWVIR